MNIQKRNMIIERLIDDKVDTICQWALQDLDSLRQYVVEAENLEEMDDDFLEFLYKKAFGEEIE